MTIIIDTSILISTLLSRGKTHLTEVIRLAKSKQLTIAISPETLSEFKQAIQSDKVKHFIAYDARLFASFIAWYQYNTKVYTVPQLPTHPASRDVNDNIFLQLAIVSKADYLITGDKDLLVMDQIEKTRIVEPEEFIQQYRKQQQS